MTLTHEPVHLPTRANPTRRTAMRQAPAPQWPQVVWHAPTPPHVDVYAPRRDIRIDQTFWQHRSIFAGSQEQLDQLRQEADTRAAERAHAHAREQAQARERERAWARERARAREQARERERAREQAQARERERAIARARAWEHAQAQARADAEYRRAWHAAAERAVLAVHRPMFKRWKPVMMAGLIPTLWAITTCRCGDRWPCNDAKLLVRRRVGWNTNPDKPTKQLTRSLPKPATRLTHAWRYLTRRRHRHSRPSRQ